MSKHHQSHRRRSYGRRQHELHERPVEQRSQHEIELDANGRDERDPSAGRYELEQVSQPLSFSVGD
ncbi:MAG TPA: hypothetical protein VKR24_04455 [Candidatus Limnocylindrales bacterium]|nr:hypothetical protein [Candidatus Limnocylindrales bacterium]